MKALAPSKKNKLVFAIIFNLFILSIIYFVTLITWKLIGAVVFINLLILSNWLLKTVEQMDERETALYLKLAYNLSSFSGAIIAVIFSLHLVLFQNMSVIEFMIYTGLPVLAVMSWQSYLLKRELSEDAI